MKTIHRFINFTFHSTVEATTLLNALCAFQKEFSTQELQTFTVMENGDRPLAFSQTYKKTTPGFCYHGQMWKHEPGAINPDSPSFGELLALVPVNA